MRNRNAILKFLIHRFVRANRIPAVLPPQLPPHPKLERLESGPVLNSKARTFFAASALVLLLALSAHAGVHAVGTIGLTVDNLDHELAFYTNVLPFQLIDVSDAKGVTTDQLLNLHGAHLRTAELQLGSERITLTEHLTHKGRAIPADSQSFDHWFQHIAIVVRDMDQAYAQLRSHHVKQVSTAPQTLPDWNKNAAGIKAFYFRDLEDHVLEVIFFPPGKGDPKWQTAGTNLFLGIDHTAIVVSDTEKSLAFYRDQLGLRVAGESENYGVEQEHLNQVFGAHLRITSLRAESGPGIEFLEYLTPSGGRDQPPGAHANDLIFWNTHLVVEPGTAAALRQSRVNFVTRASTNAPAQIIRDPDGHALELDELPAKASIAAQK